jgi:hypothetical protein
MRSISIAEDGAEAESNPPRDRESCIAYVGQVCYPEQPVHFIAEFTGMALYEFEQRRSPFDLAGVL